MDRKEYWQRYYREHREEMIVRAKEYQKEHMNEIMAKRRRKRGEQKNEDMDINRGT